MGGESRYMGLAYVTPFIIGLLIFTAIPFIASLYLSFTDYNLLSKPTWRVLRTTSTSSPETVPSARR